MDRSVRPIPLWHQPKKLLLHAIGLLSLLGLLWLSGPIASEQRISAPDGDNDRVRFGGQGSVGQLFVPEGSLKQLRIRFGAVPDATGRLTLRIRSDYAGSDLRTASSALPKDGAEHITFTFKPINPPSDQLVWILEAPDSQPKSVWVYHETDAAAYPKGTALVNGQATDADFGFTASYQKARFTTLAQREWNLETWEKQSVVFAVVVVAVACLLGLLGYMPQNWPVTRLAVLLAGLTIILHALLASRLPVINDEGAYIQDVLQTKLAFLPVRDFLTKGLLYFAFLKIWQIVTGPESILSWRLFSAVTWAGAVVLSLAITRDLNFSRRAQVITGTLFAVCPAAVALTTPLLLQPLSITLALLAVWIVLRACRSGERALFIAGAMIMTSAYLVRSSSAVVALVGALIILFRAPRRWQALVWYVGVGLSTFGLVVLASLAVMGAKHTAILLNFEALLISSQRAAAVPATVSEPVFRQLVGAAQTLWRTGPLLLTGLFLAPALYINRKGRLLAAAMAVVIAVCLGIVLFHLNDTQFLLPGDWPLVRATIITLLLGLPASAVLIRLTASQAPPLPAKSWQLLCLIAAWVVLLAALYNRWGKFQQVYLTEFLPPLIFCAAWSLDQLWRLFSALPFEWFRRAAAAATSAVIIASLYQGWIIANEHRFAGTMTQDSLEHIVAAVQAIVPPNEPIFTAQPTVTALSQRPIVFGYSHPGWYLYEQLGTVPTELRRLMFVEPPIVTEYLRSEAQFVLTDRRTDEVYFTGYPERQTILENQFELVAEVKNELSDPFRLYRRHTP